jgi:hypothetical protein
MSPGCPEFGDTAAGSVLPEANTENDGIIQIPAKIKNAFFTNLYIITSYKKII